MVSVLAIAVLLLVAARPAHAWTVFAAGLSPARVVAIDTATGTDTPIPLAAPPQAIAVAPDGRTAYAVGGSSVTPIDTYPAHHIWFTSKALFKHKSNVRHQHHRF